MKSPLLFSLILFTCLASFAQPQLFFPETTRHFGDIEPSSNGRRHFVFANTGDEPLQLLNCKTSCGCLVASWPKEPIQPGEWAEIELQFHTGGGRVGRFIKTITVNSNDSLQPVQILRIKGNILEGNYAAEREYKAKQVKRIPERMQPLDTLSFMLELDLRPEAEVVKALAIYTHTPVDPGSTNRLIHDTYLEGDTLVFDVEHLACGKSDPAKVKPLYEESIPLPTWKDRKLRRLVVKVNYNEKTAIMDCTRFFILISH